MENEKVLSNSELINITAGADFLSATDLSVNGNIAVPYYGVKSSEKPKNKIIHGDITTVYSIGPSGY